MRASASIGLKIFRIQSFAERILAFWRWDAGDSGLLVVEAGLRTWSTEAGTDLCPLLAESRAVTRFVPWVADCCPQNRALHPLFGIRLDTAFDLNESKLTAHDCYRPRGIGVAGLTEG